MKQIVKNRYLKVFKFSSTRDLETFLIEQNVKELLSIQDENEDNYYCCISYNSLTCEKQFVISFSSTKNEEDLNFLFWQEHDLFLLDTGKYVYLIDGKLAVIASFEITTHLMGLYLTNNNNLLILEEASLKLINSQGKIVKDEIFDLINDFSIKDDILSIKTYDDGTKIFEIS